MAKTIEPLKSMRIGCDNVVWTALEADADAGLVYKGDIYSLPGVMSLNINPNMSIETAYYDDGPGEVATTLGNIEISFNKSALGLKEQAILLGSTYAKKQITPTTGAAIDDFISVSGVSDIPAWGALGFRSLKSDGTYRYVWLYKGKFSLPTSNNETKGDSVSFQSDEISGRFVSSLYKYALQADAVWDTENQKRKISPWKVEWDETNIDDQAVRAKIKKDWFAQVILPTYDPTT